MIKVEKAILWGTTIGYFSLNEAKSCIAFEYDDAFLTSGIEVSPIMMPLSKRLYEFPDLIQTSFKGNPGLLADSLPDKFGNAVIDQWLAAQGKTSNFDKDDLIQCGLTMDIKVSKCHKIIDEVYHVVMQFDTFARKVNLKETTINLIKNVLKKRHATIFVRN